MCALDLQKKTVEAWDAYIRSAAARMQMRLDGRHPFLWSDEAPGRRARLRGGEILVAPASGRGAHSVPDGLIHDWIGAVFIPNATSERVLAVVRDYGRYKEFYKPVVADSRVIACSHQDHCFALVLQHRAMLVSAAVETQYQTRDFVLDEQRGYRITSATRVQEIEDYGRADQHLLPPDRGSGFIWRLQSIVRYEERDGGLYLEMEAIALTREIPFTLRWVVNPLVNRLSTDSMTASLGQTRAAVIKAAERPGRLISSACDPRMAKAAGAGN